jgi:hypothetical protein
VRTGFQRGYVSVSFFDRMELLAIIAGNMIREFSFQRHQELVAMMQLPVFFQGFEVLRSEYEIDRSATQRE